MRLGGLVFFGAVRGAVPKSRRIETGGSPAWIFLFTLMAAAGTGAPGPAQGAQLQEMALLELPWSALPPSSGGVKPVQLVVPRLSLVSESDPTLEQWSEEPAAPAVGTALWSGDKGSLLVGFSVDEKRNDDDYEPGDRLFGDLRKRYTAIFSFDQPLGFQTALIVDVLSKNKKRGQREFKIFQIAVSHPFGETGNVTAGTAVLLDGLKPELNMGIRIFMPLNEP
jgi:hypothetical protein